MTLEVSPEELDEFARRAETLSSQCVDAAQHVENYLSIGAAEAGAFFLPVMQQVEGVRDALLANIDSMRHLTERSAQNLADAAKQYRDQESANTDRLGAVGGGLP